MDKTNIDSDNLSKLISSKYSIDVGDIAIFKNKEVSGQSGMNYIFDFIIEGNKMIMGAKLYNENTTTNDIMIFNSEAMDVGITKKLILSSTEVSEYIRKMCNVYGIDIIDIKKIQQRIKFGISILDTKLSGGLRPGYVYMISGKTGAGKTTLGSTFLSYGASIGERGLMILTDTFPDQFLDNIRTMDIGFIDYYNKELIDVMEISDSIRSMKADISTGREDFRKFITKVVTELKKIIISKDIKRVVIDPVTLLLIADDDYINLMLNSLAMKGVTTIVTSGLRNTELSMFGIEEYYATGIIKLDYSSETGGISRTMNIVKMRGTFFDSTSFNFRITANGIETIQSPATIDQDQTTDSIFKSVR